MCTKRIIMIKRSFFSLLLEALIPVLFVGFGFWIMQLTFFYDSPAREIKTSLFPLPQRILVNLEPVIKTHEFDADGIDVSYDKEFFGEDFEFVQWNDNSVIPLIKNLPSSYTLQKDYDFEVEFFNYTEVVALARQIALLKKEGVELQLEDGEDFSDFNLFTEFDKDHFSMRYYGDPKPYRFGSYLVF